MKNNVYLLAVFGLLLLATYFFQEKRVEKEHFDYEVADRVLPGELKSLKIPAGSLELKNKNWWLGSSLVAHQFMKQLEGKIHGVKKIKNLTGDPKTFFTSPIELEVNGEKWILGDESLDKQGFYLSRNQQLMLAIVEGESHELTQNEAEIPSIKYQELRALLSKKAKDLEEKQLFRFYSDLNLESVTIEAEGNLPFELNVKENTTVPPPIPGITVHEDLRKKLLTLITQMSIKENLPFELKSGFKKLSHVTFKEGDKMVARWEIWLKDKKSADAIFKDPLNKRSFLMVGGSLKLFFIHLQDFWDKKVIPPSVFKPGDSIKTVFIQGKKKADVLVLNREPLKFEVQASHEVKEIPMAALIQYIFNLGTFDQGDRVSLLSKTERQQVLSEDHLRIEVMGQDLLLWRKKEEFIVVNLTQDFKVHYGLLDESFHGRFEDVLK